VEQELTSLKRRIPGEGSPGVEQELTSLKRRIPGVGSPGVEQELISRLSVRISSSSSIIRPGQGVISAERKIRPVVFQERV
jgi:hypothetical protein